MIKRIFKISRQGEGGFLLVELMVAVIIASIVAIGASVGIIQLMNVKSTNANTVTATKNIESAGHWLIRDVQMSEIDVTTDPATDDYVITGIGPTSIINVTTDPVTGDDVITGIGSTGTAWLWLEWSWDDGEHRVEYEIDNGKLYRYHWIDTALEAKTMVAEYIDADHTQWELLVQKPSEAAFDEDYDVTVEITISATTGGYKSQSESRTIQVEPRVTN